MNRSGYYLKESKLTQLRLRSTKHMFDNTTVRTYLVPSRTSVQNLQGCFPKLRSRVPKEVHGMCLRRTLHGKGLQAPTIMTVNRLAVMAYSHSMELTLPMCIGPSAWRK